MTRRIWTKPLRKAIPLTGPIVTFGNAKFTKSATIEIDPQDQNTYLSDLADSEHTAAKKVSDQSDGQDRLTIAVTDPASGVHFMYKNSGDNNKIWGYSHVDDNGPTNDQISFNKWLTMEPLVAAQVGKIYGTCAGAVAICVAPFVMFAQGITTFLNSMSQFVSLPILFTVLGALIFRKAPKYAPKVITAVHVIAYGAFMILKPCYPTSGEPIHYLYAIAVLFVVEFAIMWYLNKYRGTEDYVPADVGAVDLTPWKYRHIVCIIGIILAIGIYILFSPIGIAA
mgnify:FL=1